MYATAGWLLLLAVLVLLGFVSVRLIVHGSCRTSVPAEPADLTALFAEAFVIKPYLQLGDNATSYGGERCELRWHTKGLPHNWQVQVKVPGEEQWRAPVNVFTSRSRMAELGHTNLHVAYVDNLPSGATVDYRLLCDGDIAFISFMRTRNSADQPFRFAVAGDIGDSSRPNESKVVYHLAQAEPDLTVIPGDIVYIRGRVSEYMRHFFPVLNADTASPAQGAPLLRSSIVIGAPGNHDMGMLRANFNRDFTQFPDLLGYYLLLSQPLNGPVTGGGANMPWLEGCEEAQKVFLTAAGMRYPRMGNFSFEWGNSFWLVLDANSYMDWSNRTLRAWVAGELKKADKAVWKFVMYHQPSFTSDRNHAYEQRMRLLAPIFEENGVDIVFAGHVHCYERSFPLRFRPQQNFVPLHTAQCPVDGEFTIDTTFDGAEERRPDGVIYVTSGAAGATIHKASDPGGDLRPYTALYDQAKHSFTVCDVSGTELTLRQINEDGEQIDQLVIDKSEGTARVLRRKGRKR